MQMSEAVAIYCTVINSYAEVLTGLGNEDWGGISTDELKNQSRRSSLPKLTVLRDILSDTAN